MKYNIQAEQNAPLLHIKKGLKYISKYWFQSILLFFVLQIFFNKNVSVQVKMNAVEMEQGSEIKVVKAAPANLHQAPAEAKVLPVKEGIKALAGLSHAKKKAPKTWKTDDFANLSFVLNPTLQERKNVPQYIVNLKNKNCHNYIERFARVAIGEMKKYGVPASITLAQGLLESNAGDSRLTSESKNHFGIKCKPKCVGCTCRNYRDDEIYDMFRVFETDWESYREHSLLLQGSRYAHLKKLGKKDYKNWARGLKKAGYATDKKYAEKLIMIIEMLDLYQFDEA